MKFVDLREYSKDDDKVYETLQLLEVTPFEEITQFETLDSSSIPVSNIIPSTSDPPALELKPLPSHLRYAYLGESSTRPVIVSAALSINQEAKLLQVLREHQKAIG